MTPEASAKALADRPAGRAFPWPCARCRKTAVWPVVIPYRHVLWDEHRPQVVDLPGLNVPRCAECGELVFDSWAEEQVEQALRARGARAASGPGGNGGDGSADPSRRLSLEQYHDMIRRGILTDDDPVELREGGLVAKMPKNPPHSVATRLTRKALDGVVPAGWYADAQEPVTLGRDEPEPDVMVVRGAPRQYVSRHPGAADLALVVEVADTTLQRDRTTKKELYAGAGIPVYWIVNLPQEQVEVYTGPSGPVGSPDYGQCLVYGRSDRVPVVVAGQQVAEVSAGDLLP
jgi:Uma2 family endonuclease